MEPSCVYSIFSVISFMIFVTNSMAAPQFGVPGYSAAANMSSLFDLFDPKKVDSEPWNEFAEAYFPYAARPTPKNFTTFGHTQIDSPNRRSRFALKHPQVHKKIMAMKVDFQTILKTDPGFDPLNFHHEELLKIRQKAQGKSDLVVNPEAMKYVLSRVFSLPRNAYSHQENKNKVGSFIYGTFGLLDLVTIMQAIDMEKMKNSFKQKPLVFGTGSNVIGILPGKNWHTPADRPIVIGAHWDTVPNTPGLNDNGSGVTVMLEIASTLMNSKCFVNDHTIIFVAIDAEETGCLGSFEFIRSFLIPDVISDKGIQIGGAIILDSIFNWDDRPGSQDVPDQWSNVVPKKVIKSIKENENKGDFIGVISRTNNEIEEMMSKTFKDYFDRLKSRDAEKFKCHRMPLDKMPVDRIPTTKEMYQHADFWRSDHSRFWFHNSPPFKTISSIALFDTAHHRGIMRSCYHQECDSVSNPKLKMKQGIEFLSLTAQALVLLVANMSGGMEKCDIEPLLSPPVHENDFEDHANKISGSLDDSKYALNHSNMLKWILEKLGAAKESNEKYTIEPRQVADINDEKIYDDGAAGTGRPKQQFHAPYQPNYGTQINVDHLNLIVMPFEGQKEPLLAAALSPISESDIKIVSSPFTTSRTTISSSTTTTTTTTTVTPSTTSSTTKEVMSQKPIQYFSSIQKKSDKQSQFISQQHQPWAYYHNAAYQPYQYPYTFQGK